MSKDIINVKNVTKSFGHFKALNNVSVTIQRAEIVAIIGPSGSGKSTFLRIINGLESIDKGEVDVIHGDYDIGMVFQQFNLFPHMTIMENLMLAPTLVLKRSHTESAKIAREMLHRVGISNQASKYPQQLSGGQQQRAAIARSLVMNPHIMLFDEATSSLDPEMTSEVLDVIKNLAQTGMTILMVTHEMGFAKEVANRVLFFDEGKITEDSPVKEFFAKPKTERARTFLARTFSHTISN